jgi:hypothetical protein
MSISTNNRFLQRALLADAAISGVTGLMLLLGGGVLSNVLGVPAPLLRMTGAILIPFAIAVLYFSAPPRLTRGAVQTIMTANVIWVVASVAVLVSGAIAPTTLGTAFVIFQAIVVAGFADLQFTGLRRAAA